MSTENSCELNSIVFAEFVLYIWAIQVTATGQQLVCTQLACIKLLPQSMESGISILLTDMPSAQHFAFGQHLHLPVNNGGLMV